jgi:hypothetical protein
MQFVGDEPAGTEADDPAVLLPQHVDPCDVGVPEFPREHFARPRIAERSSLQRRDLCEVVGFDEASDGVHPGAGHVIR